MRKRGFTLYEILIVIVLITALALVSSLGIVTQLRKARDGKRKADLEKIKVALYDYFFDEGCFPQTLPDCGGELKAGSMVYRSNFECDPLLKTNYTYQTDEADCPQWFKVLTNLEITGDPGITKVGCQFGCGQPECIYNYGVSSSNIRVNEGCVTYYACSPSKVCIEYDNPFISQCPRVFENDPTCKNACNEKKNRCHDERGKHVPKQK